MTDIHTFIVALIVVTLTWLVYWLIEKCIHLIPAVINDIFCWFYCKSISKPTNLQITDITCDSVCLEWKKPVQGGNQISAYTILCRSEDDLPDQWQSKWISTQVKVKANGLKPRTRYLFKIRPECGSRHGEESDITDPIETKPKIPGKPLRRPIVRRKTHDSVILVWNEPEYGADLIKQYSVFYRPTHDSHGEWKKLIIEGTNRSAFIDQLESETRYSFKVCPEGEFGSGPESDESAPVKMNELLSKRIKKQWKKISLEGVVPEIYTLPVNNVVQQTRTITKCIIGKPPSHSINEKVLMLVGATGAGKTTLLNGITNYVLGVHFEDNFRFKVNATEAVANQAHSQTKSTNAYTFYPITGSPISYPLTVIDTPGFGDTAGITRDKQIVTQIHQFFSTEGGHGIDHLNGVGVVLQASAMRLTPTQRYIFESILSIFGKDVSSKIFLMTTFADGKDPQVLSAVKEAEVPYESFFKFNNSSLYSQPITEAAFDKLFWDLGTKNLTAFFKELERTDPVSIRLTKEVLIERQCLETHLQELQDKIATGLDKVNELLEEESILKEHENEMQINDNFTYEVKVSKRQAVKLPSNRKALNCGKCFMTCQYPCERSESELFNCLVMNNRGSTDANCNICRSYCLWKDHKIQSCRYEAFIETERRTVKELKARYDRASDQYKRVSDIVDKLEEELSQMQQDVMANIQGAMKCKQRLNDIALKPGKLTEVDYIDLLILTEKNEKKDDYAERIKALEELKKAAQILARLSSEGSRPTTDMKTWWIGFRQGNF